MCCKSKPQKAPGNRLVASQESEEFGLSVKMILVGDSGVGKTHLLSRLVDDTYTDAGPATIGVDFRRFSVEYNGRPVEVLLWDTAGQEIFRAITTSYYRNVDTVLAVFDTTDRRTYHNLTTWIAEIRKYSPDAVVIVVGCKSDCTADSASVDRSELHSIGAVGAAFVEVSARDNVNFHKLRNAIGAAAAATVLQSHQTQMYRQDIFCNDA